MPRLQRIKRNNGSCVFSINLPLEAIEDLNWEKGTELDVIVASDEFGRKLIMIKKEPGGEDAT